MMSSNAPVGAHTQTFVHGACVGEGTHTFLEKGSCKGKLQLNRLKPYRLRARNKYCVLSVVCWLLGALSSNAGRLPTALSQGRNREKLHALSLGARIELPPA